MYKLLHKNAKNYNFYHARKKDYEQDDVLPFHISPTPFYITSNEGETIKDIGRCVSQYFLACIKLYESDNHLRLLLNKGKPELFTNLKNKPNYLFIRPDLLYTNDGFKVCEIETSCFGLGLSALLNNTYAESSFHTLAASNALKDYLYTVLPPQGEIIYTDKTKAYEGQLTFLANEIFSGNNHHWTAKHINDSTLKLPIFRAFYLREYEYDTKVKQLLDLYVTEDQTSNLLPSPTPAFEEKALLGLIRDKRYQPYFQKELGDNYQKLLHFIPPTLIVGEEDNYLGDIPVKALQDIAELPRSKRKYALKVSGYDSHSSWAEGVVFLHEHSRQGVRQLLEKAQADNQHLYILQEFTEPKKTELTYEGVDRQITMPVRTRITPYYNLPGELLTIKATGCEHTNYIHASSVSINTAVAYL